MRSISIDPQTVKPGDYFIPLSKGQSEYKDHINQAVQNGGIILDVDLLPYTKKYRKKLTSQIVIIVGAIGKTTLKQLLFNILSRALHVVTINDTLPNEIGIPLTLLKADALTDVILIELAVNDKKELAQWIKFVRPTHIIITGGGLPVDGTALKDNALLYSQLFHRPLNWEASVRHLYVNYNMPFYSLLNKKAADKGYKLYPYSGEDKPDETLNLCYILGRHFSFSELDIQKGIQTYVPTNHRLVSMQVGPYMIIDDTYSVALDSLFYSLHYLKRYSARKLLVLESISGMDYDASASCSQLINEMFDASISIVFTLDFNLKQLNVQALPIYYFSSLDQLYHLLTLELKLDDILLIKGSKSIQINSCVDAIKTYVDTN